MPTPRNITYGTPLGVLTPDGLCDCTFSWTLPAQLGGTVVTVTVHLPVPRADVNGGRTAKQVLHDAIRLYIRAHEAGINPAAAVPAGVTALAGTAEVIDLDAPGT